MVSKKEAVKGLAKATRRSCVEGVDTHHQVEKEQEGERSSVAKPVCCADGRGAAPMGLMLAGGMR